MHKKSTKRAYNGRDRDYTFGAFDGIGLLARGVSRMLGRQQAEPAIITPRSRLSLAIGLPAAVLVEYWHQRVEMRRAQRRKITR